MQKVKDAAAQERRGQVCAHSRIRCARAILDFLRLTLFIFFRHQTNITNTFDVALNNHSSN